MANYYYVKNGGTATGDGGRYTAQQTGTWAAEFPTTAEYYDTIGDALAATTIPVDGDYIMCSDVHIIAYDNLSNPTISNNVTVVSVDNTDITLYKPGASEELSDTNDTFKLGGHVHIAGVSLKTHDDCVASNANGAKIRLQDLILNTDDSLRNILSAQHSGVTVDLINVDLSIQNTGANALKSTLGGIIRWNGGSTILNATNMINNTGSNGGYTILINGVDLTSITGIILASASTNTSTTLLRLTNCRLNSAVTLHGTLFHAYNRFEMFNCDDSTGGDFHRFYIADGVGSVRNNDSVYITADEAWYEGSIISSMEVRTEADCNHTTPFIFELPAQYVDLSSTSTDKVTIELVTASGTTLTNTDIAVFLVYPDGTTSVQPNWITSGKTVGAGNLGTDPLATGTALTTSGLGIGDWTGEPATPNLYKIDLDTVGDAGQATAVSIRIEIYKPSIAASSLYISPQLTIGT